MPTCWTPSAGPSIKAWSSSRRFRRREKADHSPSARREDAWGLFVGSLTPKEPGNYRLVASCTETGASVETDLSVQGLNRERHGRLARFDVLDEIATVSEGKLVPVSDVRSLLDHLAKLPEPEPTIHRIRIWSHPIWGAVVIVLLGVFWTGRKMVGAV